MRDRRIDLDRTHSSSISHEIGQQLRTWVGEERELPPSLKEQIDRMQKLDGHQSPSIVPRAKNEVGDQLHHCETHLSFFFIRCRRQISRITEFLFGRRSG